MKADHFESSSNIHPYPRFYIQFAFFSPSCQPDKYARWHTSHVIALAKFYLPIPIEKKGNWMTCKLLFHYFYVTGLSLPQHHEAENLGSNKTWTAIQAERNTFSIPACTWLVFWSVNITKQHVLTKTTDAIKPHVFVDSYAVQSIVQWLTKWKLIMQWFQLVKNSWSSQMEDQNDDIAVKESCKSFSVF